MVQNPKGAKFLKFKIFSGAISLSYKFLMAQIIIKNAPNLTYPR